MGDIAQGYNDLGEMRDVDACCREHDSCPETLAPQQTKYNITNPTKYTRYTNISLSLYLPFYKLIPLKFSQSKD